MFGIATREIQDGALRMRNHVARYRCPWEEELGIRVRDEDGAVNLRRAKEGWYN